MLYKKWILKYKWLEEEIRETLFKIEEYKVKFYEDFEDIFDEKKLEEEAIKRENIKKELSEKEDIQPEEDTIDTPTKPGKKLYKKLSKECHPDRKNGDIDRFKTISKLYNSENTLGLVLEAAELDIDVEDYVDEELLQSFEGSCDMLENQVTSLKKTAAWLWYHIEDENRESLKNFILKTQPVKEKTK
tara:strand:- start:364 stop:927 length:564 start_codon:yes stop_codon:yes gene_type:complete